MHRPLRDILFNIANQWHSTAIKVAFLGSIILPIAKQDALTQFGRAMQELGIQIICAETPQAKGRVERVIETLQDLLPKELRLRSINNPETGNAYLPTFMRDYNTRFAVKPRSNHNAHRPLSASDDLVKILTWQEDRILSKNLTLQYRYGLSN